MPYERADRCAAQGGPTLQDCAVHVSLNALSDEPCITQEFSIFSYGHFAPAL